MNGKIKYNLGDTLDLLKISRNKLAVEAKVRPATILDLVSGETRRLELETLVRILDTLNRLAKESEINRNITISDIIEYVVD